MSANLSRKVWRRTPAVIGYIVIALAFAASVYIRLTDFRTETGTPNLEATYHVLMTVQGLTALPLSESHLLPVVTLGNELDRNIPWGSTVPTKSGVFVYTSFPPLGFIVPYLFFKVTGLSPTVSNLAALNCALGLATAILLFTLAFRLLKQCGVPENIASLCSVVSVGSMLFSREFLQSFGLVYWKIGRAHV